MSRTQSKNIFMTEMEQFDGTKKWVISSQSLSDISIQISPSQNSQNQKQVEKTLLLLEMLTSGKSYGNMTHGLWHDILGRTLGISTMAAEELACYSATIRSLTPSSALFQKELATKINPSFVVDAAMRGEEDIVMNILRADPSYLLKKAKVKNSVGVEYYVTPLQAAIMANDIQMVEKMQEHFARLTTDLKGNPIDGFAEMQNQIKAIYIQSLNRYIGIQKTILDEQEQKAEGLRLLQSVVKLDEKQQEQLEEIEEKIKRATKNIIVYKTALEQNDIHNIIEVHNQAQEHNVFDFQPYIKAICDIYFNDPLQKQQLDDVIALINATTPEETAAVIARTGVSPIQTDIARAKSFDQLTLVEKLNRFREKLTEHMKQEIIFNPNHILESLRQNERIWDEVAAGRVVDPNNYAKRAVIFSQLVGFAQRRASEPVKQDIRQGTWYLTEENEPRARQSHFNTWNSTTSSIDHNSLIDVSVSSPLRVDGVGYKFAASIVCRCGGATPASRGFFKTYVEQKQRAFRTCYAACASMHPQV